MRLAGTAIIAKIGAEVTGTNYYDYAPVDRRVAENAPIGEGVIIRLKLVTVYISVH